jgi:hypothetical protein
VADDVEFLSRARAAPSYQPAFEAALEEFGGRKTLPYDSLLPVPQMLDRTKQEGVERERLARIASDPTSVLEQRRTEVTKRLRHIGTMRGRGRTEANARPQLKNSTEDLARIEAAIEHLRRNPAGAPRSAPLSLEGLRAEAVRLARERNAAYDKKAQGE